ncbi:hypothetical protein EDB83DRAFT_2315224 [Lactarius deliciosus]|nr:hypothetical protein EDB83DRAFT_2315224 [Lactarius deliciosus]
MSSQTDAPTKPVTRFPTPEEGLAVRTLHEATLQELINARNYPLLHIMRERNELMRERNVLRGTDTEFPEYDYLTPLGEECTLPYMAMWVDNECRVLPFRGVRPRMPWAVYPVDRRRFDASTQTDDADADTTLTEIDTPDSKSRSYAQVVLDDPQATDRRQFDASTQTKDTDMTLAGNDPLASDSKLCSEAQVALDDGKGPCEERKDKKRKSKTEDVGNSQNGFKTCDVVVQRLRFGQYTPRVTRFVFDLGGSDTGRLQAQVDDTRRLHLHARRHPPLPLRRAGTRPPIPLLQPITDNPAPPSGGTCSIRGDAHLADPMVRSLIL